VTATWRLRAALVLTAVLLPLAGLDPAAAQAAPKAKSTPVATGFPNAVEGFRRNRNEPVKIEASVLEVRDRDQVAVFKGNVIVRQGDTELRCRELAVHYEGGALAKATADAQSIAPQRIRRLVATGGVIVLSKDQRATGGQGVFDMRANTVTLSGDVVLTQGPNVMRGDRLVVDLNSGLSRLEAKGRVSGLFVPGAIREREPAAVPAPPGSPPKPIPLPLRP
jgi:lipopolysaccharide export system protein LptA